MISDHDSWLSKSGINTWWSIFKKIEYLLPKKRIGHFRLFSVKICCRSVKSKSFSNFLLVDGLKFKPLKKATLSYVIFVTVTLLSFRMMISKEDISFVFWEEITFCRYLLEKMCRIYSQQILVENAKRWTPLILVQSFSFFTKKVLFAHYKSYYVSRAKNAVGSNK